VARLLTSILFAACPVTGLLQMLAPALALRARILTKLMRTHTHTYSTQEHTYSTQELEELSEELSDSTAFDSESSAPSTSRSSAPSTSRSSSLAHARDQAFSPMRAMPQAAHQRQHRSARELLTPTFSDQGPLVSSGGAKDSERA